MVVAREQEVLFNFQIAFADFSEHPADGFMQQVFLVVQQQIGDDGDPRGLPREVVFARKLFG